MLEADGPLGAWITEPFVTQGEISMAGERRPSRRKSKGPTETGYLLVLPQLMLALPGSSRLIAEVARRPVVRDARRCRTPTYCVGNTGRLRDVCCDFQTQKTFLYVRNSNARTRRSWPT